MTIEQWQRFVLDTEGLCDWTVKPSEDVYCWQHLKTITFPFNREGGPSQSLFLHEVAHALHPQPEGEWKNHYHGGGWAEQFGRLVDKYLSSRPHVEWQQHGDTEFLMWGHIKVGEVTAGENGTWYAYYRIDGSAQSFRTLKDFPAPDLARTEVERALALAA